MVSLIHETLHRSTHAAPALPLRQLLQELRRRGTAMTEPALRRTVTQRDSGLRLVDSRGVALDPSPDPDGEGATAWVVLVRPVEGERAEGALHCLRRTLMDLSARLDDRSALDLARWCALMEEARQLPRAA